ncbi:GNAT family N-acetyltransferase [bacterium]|nr:GNAT family N-acetyltransferase [bacterium]
MIVCRIDDELELQLLDPHHAPALFALTEANRAHLRAWLPWLDTNREQPDTERFIEWSQRQFVAGKDVIAGIWHRGVLVGVAGLHDISAANRTASIGYWLAESCQGRGITTRATGALLDHAFCALGLHRVEIRCAPGNARSRAVPGRLGFTHEGTLREAEALYGRHEDLLVFGILDWEWKARGGGGRSESAAVGPGV